ncbi:MAG: hypothetical protein CMF69_12400 [Magnetovibrio sp.]|nr:hypothetical protein [Magnetovibrio sp.]|tara:strand:+ start:781 stop:1107 length:327 start_codon:yes stop_codon:yes gene_type:complete
MNSFVGLTLTTSTGLIIGIFFTFGNPITLNAVEVAETATLQCMEKCIRTEGLSKKETCKSRCASLPAIFDTKHKKRDCMKIYKNCNRTCDKQEKSCQQTCKQSLMQCS